MLKTNVHDRLASSFLLVLLAIWQSLRCANESFFTIDYHEVRLFPYRKMISNTNPTVEVAREGEDWTITFKLPIKTNKVAFKIGHEFSESSPLDDTPHKVSEILVLHWQK